MPAKLNEIRCGVRESSPATPGFHFLTTFNDVLPEKTQSINWGRNMPSWPMLGNDKYGCCTVASLFHFLESVGSYAGYGRGYSGTEAECLSNYSAMFGFKPNDPNTDLGGVPNLALEHWLNYGIEIDGKNDKPLAVFKVDITNFSEINRALAVFGPLIVDALLPETIENQSIWDTTNPSESLNAAPGSLGGHQFLLTSDDTSVYEAVTWDETVILTKNWWSKYITECWAVIHPVWLSGGRSLFGFDYSGLIGQAQSLYLSQL